MDDTGKCSVHGDLLDILYISEQSQTIKVTVGIENNFI